MAGRFSVEAIFKAVDRVTAPVSRMQSRVSKFTRGAERGLRSANRALSSFTRGLARGAGAAAKYGAIALGAVAGAAALLVREYSKIENAEAAFTPLLGSAEKARLAVQAINDTAATTPFQFETLASSVNQLLPVMNGNIERTIKTVRMLGDTAGGNAQKLDSITRGFTKAMLKGKVDMESLNMIAEAGVPIFQDLADVVGVEMGESFFKMVSAGEVTTEHLTKAFEKMTGAGGIFQDGMVIASKTTTGMLSTLQDNVSLTAASLGGVLAPTVKELIGSVTEVTQRVRAWVEANKEIIRARFDKIVAAIRDRLVQFVEWLQKVNKERAVWDRLQDGLQSVLRVFGFLAKHGATILKLVAAVVALSLVLNTLIAIMTAVNLVMALNPIGLVVLAVAALIVALGAAVFYWDEIKAAMVGAAVAVKDKVVGAFVWLRDTFLELPGPIQAAIAFITGPIGWLIGAAALITSNWSGIKEFFADLWGAVVDTFDAAVGRIMALVDRVKGAASFIGNVAGSAVDKARGAADQVSGALSSAGSNVVGFLGFGGDDDTEAEPRGRNGSPAQVVTPQERTARSIEERRSTSTAEVTIRDETGRAEVTRGRMGAGVKLQPTGSF